MIQLFYIDQAYVCLENRLSHWKEAVESKDAVIFHNPLESKEESELVYVGENLLKLSSLKIIPVVILCLTLCM